MHIRRGVGAVRPLYSAGGAGALQPSARTVIARFSGGPRRGSDPARAQAGQARERAIGPARASSSQGCAGTLQTQVERIARLGSRARPEQAGPPICGSQGWGPRRDSVSSPPCQDGPGQAPFVTSRRARTKGSGRNKALGAV